MEIFPLWSISNYQRDSQLAKFLKIYQSALVNHNKPVSKPCPTLCDPVDYTRLLHPWDSPGKNTGVGWVPFPSLGDLPGPGTEFGSPALQADALTAEPPRKPWKNWLLEAYRQKYQFWNECWLWATSARFSPWTKYWALSRWSEMSLHHRGWWRNAEQPPR